jgi:hypothetical protein
MPVHTGKDSKGCYAQWGGQKKYYYPCGNKAAMGRAKQKAAIQGYTISKQTGRFESVDESDWDILIEAGVVQEIPEAAAKAYPTEHACRIFEPPKGARYFRDNSKDPNLVIALGKGVQAYRYPIEKWSASRAQKHCTKRGGTFTKATGKVKKEGFAMWEILMNKRILEGVSTKPWSQVDKSKLPKSAFLWIEGDGKLKSQWHLPYKDEQGNVNLGALRAISAAIAGARTGKPMSVPPEVRKKLDNLLKRYKIGKYAKAKKSEKETAELVVKHWLRQRIASL